MQPGRALVPDRGGTALVGRLLDEAPGKLAAGGCVPLPRIDLRQDAAAGQLAAYGGHRLHNDLGGRVRVLEAWR